MIHVKEALSSNLIDNWDSDEMSSDDEDLQENAPQSTCVYKTTALHTKCFGRVPTKSGATCIQNYPYYIHVNKN